MDERICEAYGCIHVRTVDAKNREIEELRAEIKTLRHENAKWEVWAGVESRFIKIDGKE